MLTTIVVDSLAGAAWRSPGTRPAAAALAGTPPGWLPPGRATGTAVDGHPAVQTGFVPGLDLLVPPVDTLLLAPARTEAPK